MISFPLRTAVFASALAVCFGLPAAASVPMVGALSADDQADLHRVETYLDAVKSFTADFEQTAQDGSMENGKVFLSRPGKMRFEYQPPAQVMIVSNGDYVAVDDKELKQVQFYPVDSTPVWFLLRESIRLSGDVTVIRLERGDKVLRVTCVQTKDPNAGSITLVFSDQPLALRQWTVVDQQGRTTTVALDNISIGAQLDPALFKLPAAPAPERTPGHTH